jgi:cell wall-associated NlpC family hydrolase
MALAGALLMVPIVALMWVPSYAKIDPELFGFPFFFWYQFLWVFLCSALTYTAYRLTLAARPPRTPGTPGTAGTTGTTSTTDRTDGTGGTDGSGGSHTPDGDR